MTDHRPSLEALRAEIDSIDDAILDLMERRLAASAAIADAKSGDRRHLKLRPARQAAVIARLQERAARTPAAAVAAIWRELMACGLQAQARTEIVLHGPGDRDLLEARARAQFGSATPISWAADATEALRRAREEEAVAILAGPLPAAADPLNLVEILRGADGEPVAYVLGRVAAADTVPVRPQEPKAQDWSPRGWRRRKALQMPVWPDADALARAEERLAESPPLVAIEEVDTLSHRLARVAEGRGFLLQGGDCAESFAEFSPEKVRRDERLLLALGGLIAPTGLEVVHVARAAGQFAKPRSALGENVGGVYLPSYRGDAVNGRAFTPHSRMPDPGRLIEAHRQSKATIGLLGAYRASGRAQPPVYVSHEALLLNYEEALTRRDPRTGRWWAGSGHMVWLGDRTRGIEDAHVEYARGIANPVGLKCGPGLDCEALLRLIDRLDPDNRPGRLVLIGRFGAAAIGEHLPALMRAVRREGRQAIWSCDPMHGNGIALGGIKTRRFGDILAELRAFFEIAAAERVHAGGIHLEMSGSDVAECLGGTCGVGEADLARRYLSHCDPRLNPAQALELAAALARLIGSARHPRSNAA